MLSSICSIQLYALRANNQILPIFFCPSKLENNRTVDEKKTTIMQASYYEKCLIKTEYCVNTRVKIWRLSISWISLMARIHAYWLAVRMILSNWFDHLEESFCKKKFNSKCFACQWKPVGVETPGPGCLKATVDNAICWTTQAWYTCIYEKFRCERSLPTRKKH